MQINVTATTRKRAVRWISCLLLLSMLVIMLASCNSNLNGVYVNEKWGAYEFKPDGTVLYSWDNSWDGNIVQKVYTIEGDKITVTGEDGKSWTENIIINRDSIEIDGVIYIKQKES